MNIPILFENDAMLIIDKPAGIVVNRADSVKEKTIQDWMEKRYPGLFAGSEEGEFRDRSGVVHRLDKETSGVLVLAKTISAFDFLKDAFKERVVKKEYTALVHGHVKPEKAEINAPIGRLPWNRTHFGVFPAGREALTAYSVNQFLIRDSQQFSLLTVIPHTGRTHQIRVHLQYIHHPIVGDSLYAGRKQSRDDRLWCPRVFLHASAIVVPTPDGSRVQVASPLPAELVGVVKTLTGQ